MATDRHLASALALVGLIAVTAAAARADVLPDTAPGITDPIAPPPPPGIPARWQVAVHGGLRVTVLDGGGAQWSEEALDYGWSQASARPLLNANVEVSYLWAPVVDVGLVAGWGVATFAHGLRDDDRLMASTASIGGLARLHWMQGRPFVPEPRVDAGVIRERLSVHGSVDDRYVGYLRGGVDWRLGNATVGADVSLGYTMTDAGPAMSPPIGGLDLSIGPYYRF